MSQRVFSPHCSRTCRDRWPMDNAEINEDQSCRPRETKSTSESRTKSSSGHSTKSRSNQAPRTEAIRHQEQKQSGTENKRIQAYHGHWEEVTEQKEEDSRNAGTKMTTHRLIDRSKHPYCPKQSEGEKIPRTRVLPVNSRTRMP
jgi:hypothetical protein